MKTQTVALPDLESKQKFEAERQRLLDERPINEGFIHEALQLEINVGLMLSVRGSSCGSIEPKDFRGGTVSEVKDGLAWISFKHRGVVYRTELIEDRNALIAWAKQPSEERRRPYSTSKELVGHCGPCGITFYLPPQTNVALS